MTSTAEFRIMNFNVPEDVKKQFDKVLAGENKRGVLTKLMQQTIEGLEREDQRKPAIEHLLPMRQQVSPVKIKVIRQARIQGRS